MGVYRGIDVPTKQKRINVVVTDRQHSILTEMGALQARSASSIIREILDTTTPLFEATLIPLRAAAEAIEKQPLEARRILDEAFAAPDEDGDAGPTLLQLMGHLAGHRAAQAQPERTERSEGVPVRPADEPSK